MLRRVLARALVAILVAACGDGRRRFDGCLTAARTRRHRPVPAEAVALGNAFDGQRCAACHGARGEGAPSWQTRGPDGRLPALAHPGRAPGITATACCTEWCVTGSDLANWCHERDTGEGAGYRTRRIRAVLTDIKTFWGTRERAYQEAASQRDPFPSPARRPS